jgi:hypothetical protein
MTKRAWLLVCLVAATTLVACKKGEDAGAGPVPAAASEPATGATGGEKLDALERTARRKIIKNAQLSLTVSSASSAQRDAGKMAERHGGHVLSSEAIGEEDGQPRVRVVFKVKAENLDAALDELRAMGKRRGSDKITSEDVTEEWIDLDARLKTQKELESRYLEILKTASAVPDLLATQKQLAEVRSEIEKMQGRKRFLENQVALSTITVDFVESAPLITASTSAFGRAIKSAGGDLVNVSAALIVGIIRLIGVLLPVALIVFLPMFLLGRLAFRRLSGAKP